VNAALVLLRVATYPTFLRWYGAAGYEAEALIGLAIYAVALAPLFYLVPRFKPLPVALAIGSAVGLVGGTFDIASQVIENQLFLPQSIVSIASLISMLTLFLAFAIAGYLGARRLAAFWPGVFAAIWSAVMAIAIAVTFGYLLLNIALPTLARDEMGDPDYIRSGWRDPQAFAIANTFDAGLTHLIEGPIIAVVLGSVGAGVGVVLDRRGRGRAVAHA
jgi:hypothetical protein